MICQYFSIRFYNDISSICLIQTIPRLCRLHTQCTRAEELLEFICIHHCITISERISFAKHFYQLIAILYILRIEIQQHISDNFRHTAVNHNKISLKSIMIHSIVFYTATILCNLRHSVLNLSPCINGINLFCLFRCYACNLVYKVGSQSCI